MGILTYPDGIVLSSYIYLGIQPKLLAFWVGFMRDNQNANKADSHKRFSWKKIKSQIKSEMASFL